MNLKLLEEVAARCLAVIATRKQKNELEGHQLAGAAEGIQFLVKELVHAYENQVPVGNE